MTDNEKKSIIRGAVANFYGMVKVMGEVTMSLREYLTELVNGWSDDDNSEYVRYGENLGRPKKK